MIGGMERSLLILAGICHSIERVRHPIPAKSLARLPLSAPPEDRPPSDLKLAKLLAALEDFKTHAATGFHKRHILERRFDGVSLSFLAFGWHFRGVSGSA